MGSAIGRVIWGLIRGSGDRPARVGTPYSILFITPSRIGDALLTTGILRHFLETQPGARVTVVASPLAASLFPDTPGLDTLIALPKRKAEMHWLTLWWALRGRRWDVVVDMRGSAFAYTVRACRRVIYRADAPGEPVLHKVEAAAALIGRSADPPTPFIVASPATVARARKLVAGRGPVLAIAPGASQRNKIWPAERFADLVGRLMTGEGPLSSGRLLLVGGADDMAGSLPIRQRVAPERLIDCLGLDLVTTFACLGHVRLLVGNDSAMMHLSAAAGAPTLGLFGPRSEMLYRPWGPNCAIVRGTRPFADHSERTRAFRDATYDMLDLEVDAVEAAALSLLGSSAGPADGPSE